MICTVQTCTSPSGYDTVEDLLSPKLANTRTRETVGPGSTRLSMASIDLKSRIEDRINRGLLGQWYPVCKSIQVKAGKALGVRALGRHLALWRSADGRINCLEDFCPHR